MTGYRHRYAETLDDWAALHGHDTDDTTPHNNRCATHGPIPGNDPNAECEPCNIDAHDHGQRIRHRRDRDDIADAEYTHRYTLGD